MRQEQSIENPGENQRCFDRNSEKPKQDAKHAQWWLEHVLPEHFAKNRIEIQHEGNLEHTLTIPEATINEIAKARRAYEEKRDNEQEAL